MVSDKRQFVRLSLFAAALAVLAVSSRASAQCAGNRMRNSSLSTGLLPQLGLTSSQPLSQQLMTLQQQNRLLSILQQQQQASLVAALRQQQTALQTALNKVNARLTTLQDQQTSTTSSTAIATKLAALTKKQAALTAALQQTTALLSALQSTGTITTGSLGGG